MLYINKVIVFIVLSLTVIMNSTEVSARSKRKSASIKFEELAINYSLKMLQPVIAADLIAGNGKELITIGLDGQKQRWLVIYHYDKENQKYEEFDKVIIPKQYHSFDLGEYKEGHLQTVYFMSSKSLAKYQPLATTEAEKFSHSIDIRSIILKNTHENIQKGSFIKDLNGDAFDDVLISDFYNINILVGQADGSLVSQSLPIEPEVNVYSKGVTYQQTKLYLNDMNFDKKIDIIKVGEGEMQIYYQLGETKFDTEPSILAINSSINRKEEDIDVTDLSISNGSDYNRKLEELRDLNNDGITDMVALYTKNSGVFDIENNYEIYLGKNIDSKIVFQDKPDSIIKAEGTLIGLKFVDIDNDNKFEILTAGFEIGVIKIIDVLLTGDVDMDVYLFKMNEQDKFSSKPIVSKEVELSFSLSTGQGSIPIFELADLNGDKLKDLVLSNSDEELKIFYGQNKNKNKLFTKKSSKYRTDLPKNGQMVLVSDLNHDGKDDLLFKLSQQEKDEVGGNIKVLLSR